MTEYSKPIPVLGDDNRPFWEACRNRELRMQGCSACGHLRFPISRVCPRCLAGEHTWQRLSGRGKVFAYVVFHQVYHAGFRQDVPYNVALVQLDEGPRMYSNVVDVPNERVKVGDELEVVFHDVTPEMTIPRFRPRI